MEHSFWHDRWQSGRIGFHEGEPNPLLVKHFPALSVPDNGRVFVPLCGKTLDIGWLLAQGHRVAGAELSELAIQQLFEELGVGPEVTDLGDLKRYSTTDLDIYVGDIFNLTADMLGPVDAVFDRAALVALPENMRTGYAPHIATITGNAQQLVISFEYDTTLFNGPPFSIEAAELGQLYGTRYRLSSLALENVTGGMKGAAAKEHVWLLKPL